VVLNIELPTYPQVAVTVAPIAQYSIGKLAAEESATGRLTNDSHRDPVEAERLPTRPVVTRRVLQRALFRRRGRRRFRPRPTRRSAGVEHR